MNLLMLSGDSSAAQGRDNAFYQMLRRFSAYWTRIDILCPRAPGTSSRTLHGNVYIHPSPYGKALHPYFIRRKGRELMAERDYALVTSHDFGFFYNGLGARWLARGTDIPVVSEIHHVEGYPRALTHREQVYHFVAEHYIRWMKNWVAAVRVVNAVEVPQVLRRLGVPDEKILVLPSLYIDFEVFHPLPDEPRCYDLLFVGRLVPNKGVLSILEALALVRQTHPQAILCIVGQGQQRETVERRIGELGLREAVTLIPHLESPAEVARLYNQARMLVCASSVEGGPRVTVEAMACGTPVISTPVGVMSELLHDGENGLLWRWDIHELAAKIRSLLDDDALRKKLGEAGRQSVQRFQVDAVIEAYARGYHQLIERVSKN
jgi:glycosyltransferase involved in cell wall biosynthesis